MAKQRNYAQDITPFLNEDVVQIGGSVFRFATPDNIVVERVYGDGGLADNIERETIELHLYNKSDNSLAYSFYVPMEDKYLYVRNSDNPDVLQMGLEIWNPENPEESLLVKYLSEVQAGFYNVVINFFSNEIGSATVDEWKIEQISSSRNEIILQPQNDANLDDLNRFLAPFMFAREVPNEMNDKLSDEDMMVQRMIFDILSTQELEIYLEESDEYKQSFVTAFQEILDLVQINLVTNITLLPRVQRIGPDEYSEMVYQTTKEVLNANLNKFPEGNLIFRNI